MNNKFDTEKILAETNLVELVSRYVELKPDGREYKALCVAHNDTDPSMHVVPDKNFVHCLRGDTRVITKKGIFTCPKWR